MRKIALSIALLCLGLRASAQVGFILGLSAGPQNTWISNRDDKDEALSDFAYKLTFGYAGSVKAGYNIAPIFGIHSGITYSVQGQKNGYTDSSTGIAHINRRELTYLKVPVLIHVSSDPYAPVTLVMEAGPQFGFLRKAVHYTDKQIIPPGIDPLLIYEKRDIGLAWGIGAEFRFAEHAVFSVMHRGDYGLFDMEEKTAQISPGVDYYPDLRVKSNNLNLGLLFGLIVDFKIKGLHPKYDKRLYWKGG